MFVGATQTSLTARKPGVSVYMKLDIKPKILYPQLSEYSVHLHKDFHERNL